MVKILSIMKKGNSYLVTTNNAEHKFTEDVIVKHIISKNKKYSDEEFNEILAFSNKSDFYNKVLNFLSYKDRSIDEVKNYLIERNCLVFDEIIFSLINKKLLNDNRYSHNLLENCITNLKGPIFLKHELKKKGIDDIYINKVLTKYSDDRINNNLNILIDKELRNAKSMSFNKYKNQLTSKFMRLGYNYSNINQIISERKI